MPKRKFQVIKATTREIPGVTVGGRVKKFSPNGTFETADSGEAEEIDKVLGAKGTGEVAVTSYTEKEPGHTYTFGPSKKFADAWEAFEKRRKDKKKRTTRRKDAEVNNGIDIIESNAKGLEGTRPRPGHHSHRRKYNHGS
jgi:hypothetical protein